MFFHAGFSLYKEELQTEERKLAEVDFMYTVPGSMKSTKCLVFKSLECCVLRCGSNPHNSVGLFFF